MVQGIALLGGLREPTLGRIDHELVVGIDRVVRLAHDRAHEDLHVPRPLDHVLVHCAEAVAVALEDLVQVAVELGREAVRILLEQERARGVQPQQVRLHDPGLQCVIQVVVLHMVLQVGRHEGRERITGQRRVRPGGSRSERQEEEEDETGRGAAARSRKAGRCGHVQSISGGRLPV